MVNSHMEKIWIIMLKNLAEKRNYSGYVLDI